MVGTVGKGADGKGWEGWRVVKGGWARVICEEE